MHNLLNTVPNQNWFSLWRLLSHDVADQFPTISPVTSHKMKIPRPQSQLSTLPISHSIFNLHSQLLRILSYFHVYKKREPPPSHHCFSKHRNTSIALPLLLLFPHHHSYRASSHCRYTHPHLQSMFEGLIPPKRFSSASSHRLFSVLCHKRPSKEVFWGDSESRAHHRASSHCRYIRTHHRKLSSRRCSFLARTSI